ncbi:SOS response-associated peptidase [Roseivirga sp.]|uniref:SOS response-associated peptidase n=1 Tax=Roseivirga sp. TaxID=1964215 RepID=UPI002B2710B9|nr:SOS response-associated peptidase [Roseivirga sp.]
MCYSYSMSYKEEMEVNKFYQKLTGNEIQKLLDFGNQFYFMDAYKDWHPSMPVITQDKPSEIQFFHWGLIPPFAKYIEKDGRHLHPWDFGNYYSKTANAMMETMAEKPTWKRLYKTRRCLVLATGFFEFYHHRNNKQTYPHLISLQDHPMFAFAGLWDSWNDTDTGEIINSFSILTTKPNELMSVIHNNPNAHSGSRMPVILLPQEWSNWLEESQTLEGLMKFAKPFPSDGMKAVPVRQGLKAKTANANIPEVLEPMEYEALKGGWKHYAQSFEQGSLF